MNLPLKFTQREWPRVQSKRLLHAEPSCCLKVRPVRVGLGVTKASTALARRTQFRSQSQMETNERETGLVRTCSFETTLNCLWRRP